MKLQSLIDDAANIEKKLTDQQPKEDVQENEPLEEVEEEVNNDDAAESEDNDSEESEQSEQPDEDTGDDDEERRDSDDIDDLEGLDPRKADSWKAVRQKNKSLKKALQELKEQVAHIKGYQAAQSQQQPAAIQKPEVSDPEPDRTLYPEEYNAWEIRKLKQQQDQLQSEIRRRDGEQQWNKIDNTARESDQLYARSKDYLLNMIKSELKNRNPYMTAAQIQEQSRAVELQFVGQSAQAGLDPVSAIKAEAMRYGFDVTKMSKAPLQKPKVNAQKLKENIERSSSLIGRTGSAKENTPSAEKLAKTSFAKLKRDNNLTSELDNQIRDLARKRIESSQDPYA